VSADRPPQRDVGVVCSCGWTGSSWAEGKDHIVLALTVGAAVTHEVTERK
jgi:hypothetical protein